MVRFLCICGLDGLLLKSSETFTSIAPLEIYIYLEKSMFFIVHLFVLYTLLWQRIIVCNNISCEICSLSCKPFTDLLLPLFLVGFCSHLRPSLPHKPQKWLPYIAVKKPETLTNCIHVGNEQISKLYCANVVRHGNMNSIDKVINSFGDHFAYFLLDSHCTSSIAFIHF